MSRVLVTGGSGFIGGHCVLHLLAAGHEVCTTVRSLDREASVRALLKGGGIDAGARLSFVAADLLQDAGWADAVGGCEFVLHVASPFPPKIPKDPEEIITPAREGTLRVLRAARNAGVRRVVLTSSFAAIGYGHPPQDAPFDETFWTNPDAPDAAPYVRSKVLAERAAWEFMEREGGSLELSVVNPVGVLGPLLGPDYSTSVLLVKRILDGMPGVPRLRFGLVDVRDVADLHLRAMTQPAAKGERFLAISGEFTSMLDVARVLKRRMGPTAKRVPTRELPDWLLRIAALADLELRQLVPELGKRKDATAAKAMRLLNWSPRSVEEAIVASADSLVKLGLVRDGAKRAA
jgi:nucleoside-diphosphate-sugar epimerase